MPHANIEDMTKQLLHESSSTLVENTGKGTYKVLLITPGRGSSGIYSEEMLRAYGPEAFPAGSHSYIDHLGEGEQRSTLKMIGVYENDAYWDDELGGLVSDLKPFSHFKQFVEEVAPHAGFSISAQGNGEMITEDSGEKIFRVDELLPDITNSVDLVSYAGRGGRLVESLLQEALTNSAQSESSAGTGKEGKEDMATLEERFIALAEKFDGFVSAQEAAATAEVTEEQIVERIAEAVKLAVAATRKVAEAGLGDKTSEKLYAQIEEGNFDIDERLTELAEIRAEVTESLQESFPAGMRGSFTRDDSAGSKSYAVGRWAK